MKTQKKKPTVAIYTRVATQAQVSEVQQRDLILEYYLKLTKK